MSVPIEHESRDTPVPLTPEHGPFEMDTYEVDFIDDEMFIGPKETRIMCTCLAHTGHPLPWGHS